MKKTAFACAILLMVAGMFSFQLSTASAGVLGNGSAITDTLQVGEITDIGNRSLKIETRFEKAAKSYTLDLLPDCYVQNANDGHFRKFSELKKGDLIAAYGWYKDGKWNARRVNLLDRNSYLVKRLEADAKAGSYYKHEAVK